jgi:hypothetical protein
MSKNYILDVFTVLIGSEKLKRLLWYPPENILNNTPDPLSPILPDISANDELNWQCIEDRILLNSKSDDLAETPKCRIYLYLGGRNRTNSPLFEDQEIIIDVLWHETFDKDLRFSSISSTLDNLLIGKRITGMGKLKFYDGYQINAPQNYSGYHLVYQVGCMKK